MRRTRHRRRFHTDRVVANRRARYQRERWSDANDDSPWALKRLSYGRLSTMDPWDCGRHCDLCHYGKFNDPRRTREKRQWQAIERAAY